MAESTANEEKKYKVNLGKLCKVLNELTGGAVTNYTGYYCHIYQTWTYCQVLEDEAYKASLRGETDLDKYVKNCKINLCMSIGRSYIVPIRFGFVENPYPAIYFEKLPVHLLDNCGENEKVYHHITDGRKDFANLYSWKHNPRNKDCLRYTHPRHIRLSEKAPLSQLTVTITESDIVDMRDKEAISLLRKAISVLTKTDEQKADKKDNKAAKDAGRNK